MNRPSLAVRRIVGGAVVALFCLSGGVLWTLGWNYDGLTGAAFTKIHPFTYLIFAALVCRAAQDGGPLAYARAKLRRRPAAAALFVWPAALLLQAAWRGGPGLAGPIDTYAAPAAFALLLDDYTQVDLRPLTKTLHVLMTANALLGLIEFATHTLVFPYRFDGAAHLEDTRSTALQGHPLMNAALTAVYVIALMAGAKTMPAALRVALILLQFAALAVFGGRTAMVVALALAPLYAIIKGYRALARGRVSLLTTAGVFVAVPMLALLVAAALSSGLTDRLLSRFVDDNGSAASRIIMFDMLGSFGGFDLAFGPDLEQVENLRRHFGLEQGVENPFVRMTLYQGAIAMTATFTVLALFFRELLRGRGWATLGPLLAMVVLINASESISVKTNFLDKLVLIFVALFPLARAEAPRPVAAPARTVALARRRETV